MVKEDLNWEPAESEYAAVNIMDNGGTRSGLERRRQSQPYKGAERRSGKDRRRGHDRRNGLPRRRTPDRRSENRLYWNGTAVERRDAFRK